MDFNFNSAKCSVYYHVLIFIIYILVSLQLFILLSSADFFSKLNFKKKFLPMCQKVGSRSGPTEFLI